MSFHIKNAYKKITPKNYKIKWILEGLIPEPTI
jgi:hypothetical protein